MITKGKSMHSSEAIDFARRAAKRISKIEGPVNLPPAPEEKDKEENEKQNDSLLDFDYTKQQNTLNTLNSVVAAIGRNNTTANEENTTFKTEGLKTNADFKATLNTHSVQM